MAARLGTEQKKSDKITKLTTVTQNPDPGSSKSAENGSWISLQTINADSKTFNEYVSNTLDLMLNLTTEQDNTQNSDHKERPDGCLYNAYKNEAG